MSRVNEEACDDTVPRVGLLLVHVYEFTSHHREIILIRISNHDLIGAHIWNFDLQECILVAFEVAKAVDERVDSVLFFLLAYIQHEVRAQKTEVGELISLTFVALKSEFEDKSAKTAPWMQYADALASFSVVNLPFLIVYKIVMHLFHDRLVTLISFALSDVGPFSHE